MTRDEKHKEYEEIRDYINLLLSDWKRYGDAISDEGWNFWMEELDRSGEAYIDNLRRL